VVAESADAGAADGAGAQVNVEEPWSGYGRLRAADVAERLPAEPQAVVALVLLHERANRARRTVIAAAERELARRSVASPS
jgi:hypothetical protein